MDYYFFNGRDQHSSAAKNKVAGQRDRGYGACRRAGARPERPGLTVRVCELVYAGPHRDSFFRGGVYISLGCCRSVGLLQGCRAETPTSVRARRPEPSCAPGAGPAPRGPARRAAPAAAERTVQQRSTQRTVSYVVWPEIA